MAMQSPPAKPTVAALRVSITPLDENDVPIIVHGMRFDLVSPGHYSLAQVKAHLSETVSGTVGYIAEEWGI